ncbi:MAG: tRNA (guanosine(46)-N7)-methyltransferase TrmB [Myxococcota bacterium]
MSDLRTPALSVRLEAEALRERGPAACLGADRFVLEIGFGRAELIMELAEAEPERVFLGVEVSRKRVEKAARRVERRSLGNVRLIHAPAEYLLERVLPPACVEECWICCPDPWPKKRHHKRRLIRSAFLSRLVRVLVEGAEIHISTDHRAYAEWIHEALVKTPELENLHAPDPWASHPPARPRTAYEAEWLADGRRLVYFDYRIRRGSTP